MSIGSSRRPASEDSARPAAVGRRLLAAGHYEEAVPPLEEAARRTPADPGITNDLGVAYMASRQFARAATWFRRSIAAAPDVGDTHYNLGLALQHLGESDAAIVAHRRAVSLSGELAGALAQLGDLLWETEERSEAVSVFERAYAAAPGTTRGRLCKVKALSAARRDREAETELRLLLASDPSSGLGHVLLGRILQEAGRFDEAIASFERAVAVDPWQTNGYLGLVSSRRITEVDRPLVAQLVSLLDSKEWPLRFGPAAADERRTMLHFAAGKALDDLGDVAGAMAHFQAANGIRQRLCPFDRGAFERLVDQLIQRFTPDFFARHRALGLPDETPVLIIGMPRSGTTLLERILSSHPTVRGRGELSFWNERGPAWALAPAEALAGAAADLQGEYLGLLRADGPDALRVTDKMPFNFCWVGLVHLLLPGARFVHSRRSPLDTCASLYTTAFTPSWGFTSTVGDLAAYYRQYARLVAHWRAVIPAGRFLDLDYEAVVAEPEANIRRLVAFAGIPWDPAYLSPEKNRDAVRTASSWQARQPIYRSSIDRWTRWEPVLAPLRELLAGA